MSHSQLSHGQIRLRPLEPEDLEFLYQWENDPTIWKVSNTLAPYSRFILKQYIQESHRDLHETKQLRLIIEDQERRVVGAIDLFDFDPFNHRAGVGILIYNKSDRRKGLATDALHLMCEYGLNTLGLHQMYANIRSDNSESKALFEKEGFHLSGIKKEWIRTPDGWTDEIMMQKIL